MQDLPQKSFLVLDELWLKQEYNEYTQSQYHAPNALKKKCIEERKEAGDDINQELLSECIICSETLDLQLLRQTFLKEKLFPRIDDNKGKKNFMKANQKIKKDLDQMMIEKQSLTLDCGHQQFHSKCIKDWLEISPDCPLCKKGVDYDKIEAMKPEQIIHKI